ncbi:MAG: winged helix-turn-helix domain-containing protein [Candidatus Uhrbacteria bacterium]|nr:winged helix-turn-helix domain-containing protein [Candidatus Uhrbacteria bacterium]
MKTRTKDNIIDFVSQQNQTTAKLIIEYTGLTPPAVFRHLSKLISEGILKKQGIPPKVFYSVVRPSSVQKNYAFDANRERLIKEELIDISCW